MLITLPKTTSILWKIIKSGCACISVICVNLLLLSNSVSAQSKSCFDNVKIEPGLIAFNETKGQSIRRPV